MENVVNRSRHEPQYMQRSSTGSSFANILIGAVVGAGAALLFAPKSGRQIRKEIAKQASMWSDQASKITDQATKEAKKRADKWSDQASKLTDRAPDVRKMTGRKKSGGTGKMFMGIAIGSAVGAAAALLLAPKSGRQMRKQLKQEADELGSRARETADQARSKAREMANEAEGEMKRQKEIMEDVNTRDYPL